ncbi:MAG TPA: hypothetical protein VGN23_12345 [Verrucomicrobiae bacterium]|jgi:hypothetical protein
MTGFFPTNPWEHSTFNIQRPTSKETAEVQLSVFFRVFVRWAFWKWPNQWIQSGISPVPCQLPHQDAVVAIGASFQFKGSKCECFEEISARRRTRIFFTALAFAGISAKFYFVFV